MNIIIEIDTMSLESNICGRIGEIYEKHYKDNGWLFDKIAEAIYMEKEIPFMPQEGQRLGLMTGSYIVTWSNFEVDEKEDASYFYKSRIIIEEE